MLISLGKSDYIDIKEVVAIFNFDTLDLKTKAVIQKSFSFQNPRSVILTRDNKWVGATLSTEAITGRVGQKIFSKVYYHRKKKEFHKQKASPFVKVRFHE